MSNPVNPTDFSNYLQITIRSSNIPGLIANDNTFIPAVGWVAIQNSNYSAITFGVSYGLHRVWHQTEATFGLCLFGQYTRETYHITAPETVFSTTECGATTEDSGTTKDAATSSITEAVTGDGTSSYITTTRYFESTTDNIESTTDNFESTTENIKSEYLGSTTETLEDTSETIRSTPEATRNIGSTTESVQPTETRKSTSDKIDPTATVETILSTSERITFTSDNSQSESTTEIFESTIGDIKSTLALGNIESTTDMNSKRETSNSKDESSRNSTMTASGVTSNKPISPKLEKELTTVNSDITTNFCPPCSCLSKIEEWSDWMEWSQCRDSDEKSVRSRGRDRVSSRKESFWEHQFCYNQISKTQPLERGNYLKLTQNRHVYKL